MELNDLEIYRLSREISRDVWEIYKKLSWEDKKIMGYQCISATDSIGANIAEGFGRYHYLDKNKFNLNSRGSLLETIHWLEILNERKKMSEAEFKPLILKLQKLHIKLNNYITSTRKLKEGN
jgi:four helix bundle protein